MVFSLLSASISLPALVGGFEERGSGRTVEIRSISMLPSAWEKLDALRGEASRGMWISARVNRDFNARASQSLSL